MPIQDGFEHLSATRLIAALGGDRELLAEIIQLFLRDAPAMFHSVRLAAAEARPEALEQAAHVLKGSAANFGLSPLYELARELERCALSKQMENVPGIMARFDRAAEGFERALTRMRSELTP